MSDAATYSTEDIRRWADAAYCDPRTLRKYLLGERVSGLVRRRIEAARAGGAVIPVQAQRVSSTDHREARSA